MKTIVRFFTALAVIAFVVAPEIARADDVYTDNLVIVMDDSGSMTGSFSGTSRMEAAKEALRTVLVTVPQTTSVGLLALNAGWRYDLGPRDDARLNAAINKLSPDRGTPLGQMIKEGADRLLGKRELQHGYGSYRLLVITDGEATDEALMNRYAPEVVARGITLDVIGVGMNTTHSLARTAHSYRAADDLTALKLAITAVMAEIGGSTSIDASREAFEAVGGLPPETAAAVISAFSTTGNYPIGETPQTPAPFVPPPSNGGSGAAGTQASTDAGGEIIMVIFLVIIFLIVLLVGLSR